MEPLEISLWKDLCHWSLRSLKIRHLLSQLLIHLKLECWCHPNLISRIELIRWLNHCWILSSNLMFSPINQLIRLRSLHPNLSWNWSLTSFSQLEHRWCRHPNQKSRTMRIMLGILNHWIIRRNQLHFKQELIIFLRIIISWLLNLIRKPRMRWRFNGLCFQICPS